MANSNKSEAKKISLFLFFVNDMHQLQYVSVVLTYMWIRSTYLRTTWDPQLFLTTEKRKKKKRIHRAAQVCRMYESHKHAMPSFGLSTIQYILAPMVAELGSGGWGAWDLTDPDTYNLSRIYLSLDFFRLIRRSSEEGRTRDIHRKIRRGSQGGKAESQLRLCI